MTRQEIIPSLRKKITNTFSVVTSVPETLKTVNKLVKRRSAGRVTVYHGDQALQDSVLNSIEPCYRDVYGAAASWSEGYVCRTEGCTASGYSNRLALTNVPKDHLCTQCGQQYQEFYPQGSVVDKYSRIFKLDSVYPIAGVWQSPEGKTNGFAVTPIIRQKDGLDQILLSEPFFATSVSDPQNEITRMWDAIGIPRSKFMYSSDIGALVEGTDKFYQLVFKTAWEAIKRGCTETIGVTAPDSRWFIKLSKDGFIKPHSYFQTEASQIIYRIPMLTGVAYYGLMSLIHQPLTVVELTRNRIKAKHGHQNSYTSKN